MQGMGLNVFYFNWKVLTEKIVKPFGICLINSIANPARFGWSWARLAVLFSRQIVKGSHDINCFDFPGFHLRWNPLRPMPPIFFRLLFFCYSQSMAFFDKNYIFAYSYLLGQGKTRSFRTWWGWWGGWGRGQWICWSGKHQKSKSDPKRKNGGKKIRSEIQRT